MTFPKVVYQQLIKWKVYKEPESPWIKRYSSIFLNVTHSQSTVRQT